MGSRPTRSCPRAERGRRDRAERPHGAFAFNLAAINNQPIAVAACVIEQLESYELGLTQIKAQFQSHVSNMKETERVRFEEAVVL